MPASLRILHHPPSFLWEFCCFGFSFAIGSTLSCGVWSVYFLHFSYLDHYLDHWLWGAWLFEWEGLLKAQKFECLVPRWWHCFGKDKKVSVTRLEVCGWRLGVSAAQAWPSLSQCPAPTSLPPAYRPWCKLSYGSTLLSSTMARDSPWNCTQASN